MSRPTTLPLRIPPRISITQADADRSRPSSPQLSVPPRAFPAHTCSALSCVPVMRRRMACRRVTPRWACRARASRCTRPSLRASGGSPSSTDPTRTTTCRPRRCRGTPPWRAKGEASRRSEAKRSLCEAKFMLLSVATSNRHTAEDFIVTPFAQVSASDILPLLPISVNTTSKVLRVTFTRSKKIKVDLQKGRRMNKRRQRKVC